MVFSSSSLLEKDRLVAHLNEPQIILFYINIMLGPVSEVDAHHEVTMNGNFFLF